MKMALLFIAFLASFTQLFGDIHVFNKTPYPIRFYAYWAGVGSNNENNPLYLGPNQDSWINGDRWDVKRKYKVEAFVDSTYGDISYEREAFDSFNPWVDVVPVYMPNGETGLNLPGHIN